MRLLLLSACLLCTSCGSRGVHYSAMPGLNLLAPIDPPVSAPTAPATAPVPPVVLRGCIRVHWVRDETVAFIAATEVYYVTWPEAEALGIPLEVWTVAASDPECCVTVTLVRPFRA